MKLKLRVEESAINVHGGQRHFWLTGELPKKVPNELRGLEGKPVTIELAVDPADYTDGQMSLTTKGETPIYLNPNDIPVMDTYGLGDQVDVYIGGKENE